MHLHYLSLHVCMLHSKEVCINTLALFSSEKISDFATVTLSFLFDKYYLIMN